MDSYLDLISEYSLTLEQLQEKYNQLDEWHPDRRKYLSMINELDVTIRRMRDGNKSIKTQKNVKVYCSPLGYSVFDSCHVIDRKTLEDEFFDNGVFADEDADTKKLMASFCDYFLTHRQRSVLQMIADGLTYKEVAEILDVDPGTISKHMQLIRQKFSTVDIVALKGIVEMQDQLIEILSIQTASRRCKAFLSFLQSEVGKPRLKKMA